MDRALSAVLLSLFAASPAAAAMLTNAGDAPVILQLTDPSGRVDLSLDPGATEDVCPSGCFVTLPNGDRLGLAGSETVEIKNGNAEVK